MMKATCLLFFTLFFFPEPAIADDIVVVANIKEVNLQLDKKQVRNLFMGGVVVAELEPISLPPSSPARIIFNTKIVGLTESRIQSYWAQMRFSGRNKPPKQLSTPMEVVDYLVENEGTVAYLPADAEIPESLTVLYSTR